MTSIKKFGYKMWVGNLLVSWFGHSELQNPYSPVTWIPVEGLFLVEHHLLIPVEKVAIAQPGLKKSFDLF